MRQWNISLCMILLGAAAICVGCKSKPTKPVDAPADNNIGAETSIYEDVESVEAAEEKPGRTQTIASPLAETSGSGAKSSKTPVAKLSVPVPDAVAPTAKVPARPVVPEKTASTVRPPKTPSKPVQPVTTPKKIVGTTDQDAVKAVLVKVAQAINNNDKALFMSNVAVTPKTKSSLEMLFEGMTTMMLFEEAMVKAYGPKSVKYRSLGMKRMVFSETEVDGAKIRIKKNSATARGKNLPSLRLVNQDGVWKFDLLKMFPKRQLPMLTMMMKTVKTAVPKVMKNIGKDGYSARKIQQELVRAIMPSMMGPGMGPMGPGMRPGDLPPAPPRSRKKKKR